MNEHNEALLCRIALVEVEMVVKDTQLGKSLGPNGFIVPLFHHCWHFINDEVLKLVEE
jgi:hypothetical protein